MVIFILVKSFKASSVKKTKNNLLFDHLTQLDNMKEEWYYIQYLIVTEKQLHKYNKFKIGVHVNMLQSTLINEHVAYILGGIFS